MTQGRNAIVFAVALGAIMLGGLAGWVGGSEATQQKPLVHVVLFDLKEETPGPATDELIRDAHTMLAEIPVVTEVRAGRRAPGDRDVHVQDYDVGLYLHLKQAYDITAYLEHPLHVQFAEKHGANVQSVRVCDFYDE